MPPDDLWAEYKVWVRGTKVWAGLDTLTRWPGLTAPATSCKPAIRAGRDNALADSLESQTPSNQL